MNPKQQNQFNNLIAIFAQFGVLFIEQNQGAAYFQAAKNAPIEKRTVDFMASKFNRMTGLRFMLKAV